MAGAAAHQRVEETRRQEIKAGTSVWARAAASLLLTAALAAAGVCAVDDLETLQKRFDRETDGVRKAKLLQKLGDAQFDSERNAARSGDYVAVGLAMEKYRDNVRAALQALKKTHPDAEKHVGGYRELEMHTGLGIRQITDVPLSMPDEYRPPMRLVEQDLVEIDNELL